MRTPRAWFVEEVLPRMKGRVFLARFADDFIVGFQKEEDAEKGYRVHFQRFEKYGLSLHPEKTRLVPLGRPEEPYALIGRVRCRGGAAG